jgi:hypothetical protein
MKVGLAIPNRGHFGDSLAFAVEPIILKEE